MKGQAKCVCSMNALIGDYQNLIVNIERVVIQAETVTPTFIISNRQNRQGSKRRITHNDTRMHKRTSQNRRGGGGCHISTETK